MAAKDETGTAMIGGREYVLVPRDEYDRLTGSAGGNVEAVPFVDRTIAHALKSARVEAGLTQAELASLMGKSQPLVARAESGEMKVGAKYVAAVLDACGLPPDWSAKTKSPRR